MGKGLSIILAVISFILIMLIPMVIIGFAARPLLYPSIYIATFEKAGVYDKLPSLLSQQGMEGIFTKEFLKTNFNRMLDNALAYIRGDTNQLDLSMAIDRNQIRSALVEKFNSVPTCPAGTVPQNNQNPECFPSGFNRAQFTDTTMNSIQIPDKIDFLNSQPQLKNGIDQIRSKVVLFYNILYGLLAFSIILLVIVALLLRHSPKSVLKWIGTTLLIAGVTVVAISLVITSIVTAAVTSQTGSGIPTPLISGILDAFAGSMRLYAIPVAVIGAALLIISWKMTIKKKK